MSKPLIDLERYKQPVKTLIDQTVARFASEHPDTTVSMLVIGYAGFNPSVMVALDTPAHSDAHVREFLQEGAWAYGEDQFGKFCKNAWSCEFQLSEYQFDGFPNLYDTPALSIKELTGEVRHLSFGDDDEESTDEEHGNEAINGVMHRFLVTVLRNIEKLKILNRAPIFRVGVYIHDSAFSSFWVVP